jgi:hypothetical protein
MKKILISLSRKNKNNRFLKNFIDIRCKCGFSEKLTYYDFLAGGEFIIGQPASTISPFISEAIYEETITLTPLHLSKNCPVCKEEITAVFPLSCENLVTILQTSPPDPCMYG